MTDHGKPVDKRVYKGTFPTCHDFSEASVTSDRVHLLIGFSAGQVQLIDPIKKEYNKLFNEEVGACVSCCCRRQLTTLWLSTCHRD